MILRVVPDVVRGSEPLLLKKSSTVSDAAQLMHRHNLGAVLVLENEKLVGIFTERDVSFRVIAEDLNPVRTPLEAVMTSAPHTVQASDTVLFVLERMADYHIRHLPISDGDELVGVVALRDVLAGTTQQITVELAHMAVEPPSDCRIATDIMRNHTLASLPPNASVHHAAGLMKANNIGAILVMHDAELKGIFTERDVSYRVVSEGLDADLTSLEEVMTSELVTVQPGDSCESIAEKMQTGHFRHLPIMRDGKAVGILSIRDLLSYIRHKLENHFQEAMIERTREMISNV